MGECTIKALTSKTWEAFSTRYAMNNGGGMGNCRCTWFHREKHSAHPMLERAGFMWGRPKGTNHCIMRKVIGPS